MHNYLLEGLAVFSAFLLVFSYVFSLFGKQSR